MAPAKSSLYGTYWRAPKPSRDSPPHIPHNTGPRILPPTFYYPFSVTSMPQPRGFGSIRVLNEPNDKSPMQSLNERFHACRRQIRPPATNHRCELTGALLRPSAQSFHHEKKNEEIANCDMPVYVVCSCCFFTESGMRFLDQMDCEPQGWVCDLYVR